MQTIQKFKLKMTEEQKLEMPTGSKILDARMAQEEIIISALVDTEKKPIKRIIEIFATGYDLPGGKREYLATIHQSNTSWHLFERV